MEWLNAASTRLELDANKSDGKKCKPQGRRVARHDNKLGFARAQSAKCLLVAEHVFAGLGDHGKSRVDVLRLFLLQIDIALNATCEC